MAGLPKVKLSISRSKSRAGRGVVGRGRGVVGRGCGVVGRCRGRVGVGEGAGLSPSAMLKRFCKAVDPEILDGVVGLGLTRLAGAC